MSAFIKLTKSRNNSPILLNKNDICFIQRAEESGDTYIRLNKPNASGEMMFYFVTETMDELERLLING